MNQLPRYDISIHDNLDNEIEKPQINKKDELFNIIIPKYKNNDSDIKKLSCYIIVYFGKRFKMKILLESFIIPFDFSFNVYDYFKNEFCN